MSEYDGLQFVGIDLHRRRSVIVRTTDAGEALEAVRVNNDLDSLAAVIARAGEAPEVVLEATYGWYWAVDALEAAGAVVHLAHPLGVKMFEHRRVKNDVRDASDLAAPAADGPAAAGVGRAAGHPGAARAGPSPGQAGRAPFGLQVRGPRGAGQARHRGPDVRPVRRTRPGAARRGGRARTVPGADPVAGAAHRRPRPGEVDLFARLAKGKLVADPGYRAVQTIPGIGPVLAAVFVAEVGDVHRFPTAAHLTSWAGLTPKHHESDTHVRRGRITKQGSKLVRWAAIESVKRVGAHTGVGVLRERVAARRSGPGGRNIAAVAAARRQVEHVYYALRDGHVRALAHRGAA